jgi:hypothetical protein
MLTIPGSNAIWRNGQVVDATEVALGNKSRVRSMQRGALRRDPKPMDKSSDYGGHPPSIRNEDRAHLGLTDDAFDRLAESLKEKVLGYSKAGFRKPADVTRLLNKEKIRTLAGTDWNPRLVYFLLSRIFGNRPRTRRPMTAKPADAFDQHSVTEVRGGLNKRRADERRDDVSAEIAARRVPKTDDGESKPPVAEIPLRRIKVRPPSPPVPLSSVEMENRMAVLRAHMENAE